MICDVFKPNTTLTQIDLSNLLFGDEGITSICDVLKSNTTFTQINLSKISIGDDSFTSICDVLKSNTTLKQNKLSGNEFGDEGVTSTFLQVLFAACILIIPQTECVIYFQGILSLLREKRWRRLRRLSLLRKRED